LRRPNTTPAVAELRAALGMNRAVFGRLVGLSERTIASLEKTEAVPSGPTLRRVQETQRLYDRLERVMEASTVGPCFGAREK
jgi:DNA-binding transcriptional regulator YiaG